MEYSREQIKLLSDITSNFYNNVYESFSKSRSNAWNGWSRCLPFIQKIYNLLQSRFMYVEDFACGNLRFESFLNYNFDLDKIRISAYDNCKNLVNTSFNCCVDYYNIDIIDALLNDNEKFNLNKKSNLIVSFGLLHHVPSNKLRKRFIDIVYTKLEKNGIFICSFWQFMKDDRIKNKALLTTKKAQKQFNFDKLENNDFFLQWQDNEKVFRFCHNFTNEEINDLFSDYNSFIIDCFEADGKNNDLNKYVILQKK